MEDRSSEGGKWKTKTLLTHHAQEGISRIRVVV